MAITRTQTGAIKPKKYEHESLHSAGDTAPKKGASGKKIKKQGKGGGKGHKGQKSGIKSPAPVSEFDRDPTPQPKLVGSDHLDGNYFWPSVIFGSKEEKPLSIRERANQLVAKWEKILEEHEENLPDAVPHIEYQLAIARAERDVLGDDPSFDEIVNEEKRKQVVQERIQSLQDTLENSTNEHEKRNILGAIDGYRSGRIGYSKHYTLIWAGKIVDRADTYSEFAIGRKERLDRYAKIYGPHWLWFESPLWVNPESQTRAMRSAVVERVASYNDFGLYFMNQGFWKRHDLVTRMPQTGYGAGMQATPGQNQYGFDVGPGGHVHCGGEGPKLCFRSLLDSGATYPTLYPSDFRDLGVYPAFYPAQSVVNVTTTNGPVMERIYEMHVEVSDETGQSLIDPTDPVHPAYPNYIGGLSPVVMMSLADAPTIDENGEQLNLRLSGIMPFLASYISSTPSKNILVFGENRNDVLGAQRIPPARRWMIGLNQDPTDRSHWPRFLDPQITFAHRRGLIIDQDIGPAMSRLTVNVGMGALERSETFDPRGDYQRALAAGQQGLIGDPTVVANP